MTRRVIQIGYRIDEPRDEAVTINARLYRSLVEADGWVVDALGYHGGACSPLRLEGFLRRLARLCRGANAPIVHDFFVMPGFSLIVQRYLWLRRLAPRYVKTFVNLPGGAALGSFEGILRLGLNNSLVCHSVARWSAAATFLRELPLPNLSVLEAPPRYAPQPPRRHTGPLRAVYLGHALRKKGVHLLPEIISRVQTHRPGKVEFTLSFSEMCDDQAIMKRLAGMPGVKLVGPSEPGDFFAEADVYLLPITGRYAASGSFNTVWEAMSRGCCVVTAGVDDLPDILSPSNSVTVAIPSANAYAQSVADLIDGPDRLMHLRESAASDYAERYEITQRAVRLQLRSIYDTI